MSSQRRARLNALRSLLIWIPVSFLLSCTARAQSPLAVEDGLTIPNARTPWAVDTFANTRQLVPIHHSLITLNRHMGANYAGALAGSVFYRPKLTMELEGLRARTQLHTKTPVFYVLMEADQDPGGEGKDADTHTFTIVRVGQAKDRRVVDRLTYSGLTRRARRDDTFVETTSSALPDRWTRIEPKSPMEEGEYCILPVPKAPGTYETEVYDFGIHLDAPNMKDARANSTP